MGGFVVFARPVLPFQTRPGPSVAVPAVETRRRATLPNDSSFFTTFVFASPQQASGVAGAACQGFVLVWLRFAHLRYRATLFAQVQRERMPVC